MQKNKKLKRQNIWKQSSYAVGITVIVIVGAIVLNVLATALAQRFPLDLDLTADKTFTVSEKNVKYLQDIKQPVTITLCSSEDDYTSTGLAAQYMQYYYGTEDPTGKYLSQTLALLQEYPKYNSNITLEFADPQLPSFTDLQQRFPNQQIGFGDLLVESTFEVPPAMRPKDMGPIKLQVQNWKHP